MRRRLLELSCVLLLGACVVRAQEAKPAAPTVEPSLVALSVADLDATIDWYAQHLGFKLRDRKDFPELRMAFLQSGDFELELVENKSSISLAAIQQHLPSADDPSKLQGLVKLGFTVDDLEALAARLKNNGVRIQMGLTKSRRHEGVSFIIVRDNSGNWIQIFGKSK